MDVIAVASAVIVTASQLSVLIVGVALLLIDVTRGVLRLFVKVLVLLIVGTTTPSTDSTPDEPESVVAVACPSSIVPTPRAVEVSPTMEATGNPVQLVNVPLVGVPRMGVASVGPVARTTLPLPVVDVALKTPLVSVAMPVPVARLPVLPPVPEKRTISESTLVAVSDEKSPPPVPAPIAVLKSDAVNASTVLSALMRVNRIALGLVSVKKFLPTVVPVVPRLPALNDNGATIVTAVQVLAALR